jgi:hypothetical protein
MTQRLKLLYSRVIAILYRSYHTTRYRLMKRCKTIFARRERSYEKVLAENLDDAHVTF